MNLRNENELALSLAGLYFVLNFKSRKSKQTLQTSFSLALLSNNYVDSFLYFRPDFLIKKRKGLVAY